MRGREFMMKDGYSFDATEEGAEESYRVMWEAYRKVFARCGLLFRAVEADSGPIGGSFSHEFMVLAGPARIRLSPAIPVIMPQTWRKQGCGRANRWSPPVPVLLNG